MSRVRRWRRAQSVNSEAAGGRRVPPPIVVRTRLSAEDFYGENASGANIRAAPCPPANRHALLHHRLAVHGYQLLSVFIAGPARAARDCALTWLASDLDHPCHVQAVVSYR